MGFFSPEVSILFISTDSLYSFVLLCLGQTEICKEEVFITNQENKMASLYEEDYSIKAMFTPIVQNISTEGQWLGVEPHANSQSGTYVNDS